MITHAGNESRVGEEIDDRRGIMAIITTEGNSMRLINDRLRSMQNDRRILQNLVIALRRVMEIAGSVTRFQRERTCEHWATVFYLAIVRPIRQRKDRASNKRFVHFICVHDDYDEYESLRSFAPGGLG